MKAHFSGFAFLKRRPIQVITAVFLVQAIALYSFSREEKTPPMAPLVQFPSEIAGWKLDQETVLDAETMKILSPDDSLMRNYVGGSGEMASLFIAYFRAQRTDRGPHSPKNCLPGSGWTPSNYAVVPISIAGDPEPIRVNQYVVAKEDQKSIVLYWYQTARRVVASEYMARIYLVADSIRYNRTDTALVRIVVPVGAASEQAGIQNARRFAQSVFPVIRAYIP